MERLNVKDDCEILKLFITFIISQSRTLLCNPNIKYLTANITKLLVT